MKTKLTTAFFAVIASWAGPGYSEGNRVVTVPPNSANATAGFLPDIDTSSTVPFIQTIPAVAEAFTMHPITGNTDDDVKTFGSSAIFVGKDVVKSVGLGWRVRWLGLSHWG